MPRRLSFLIASLTLLLTFSQIAVAQPTELNVEELREAVELFQNMMTTKTYLERKENITLVLKKNKNVRIPRSQNVDLREYYLPHLIETDYKSVEEAVSLNEKSIHLTQKLMTENEKLYDLMAKASISQLKIIMEPERIKRE